MVADSGADRVNVASFSLLGKSKLLSLFHGYPLMQVRDVPIDERLFIQIYFTNTHIINFTGNQQ